MPDENDLIKAMPDGDFIELADLRESGFHTRTIRRAVEGGAIAKIAPGVYASLELASYQYVDYAALHRITGGVIFGLTAASYHGLSNALPPKLTQLIVPNEYNRKTAFPVELYRTRRPEMLTAGVVDAEVLPGLVFKVTNEARTIVDLYRNPALDQHAKDALSDYDDRKLPVSELRDLATTFGVRERIDAQLEMISFYRDRGIVPR